ncbi:isoleucine--tRNA ligase [Candidatus Micrarchaeota archaeon]|nr:isoleucine--tRNA ligase [Candidatus Micrarchaeota archaeon]MBU1681662.1 isoleucine--tRNA ligase [Candidatus Micrarchaeota archaeon]
MYDHKKLEQEMLEFWKEKNIYEKAKKKNNGNETFYFCDGPPYATGQIHPGTGWNKTLKDSVCRYQRICGKDVRVQAGYDTHGLPIEVKVEQQLKFKNKNDIEKYGIGKFVKKCKEFATKYVGIMGEQFQSLGVWMDFDTPYITYHDSYINASWSTLKMAHEKDLMHQGFYVLPYCYRCETTIANYELEYDEETDPSIYIKFKVKDKDEYLIVWTTTPWTLTANMGVMVHPTHSYVKAKVGDEIWIIAKERLDHVLELTEASATVVEELPGRKLNDLQYDHPFQDKIKKEYDRKVVLSDEYVTLEEGTGLVHTAPGHGPEDFIIGKRFGIEAFCPVNGKGNYTEEAGEFAGQNVREANPSIIELLRSNGTLLYEARIKHRYPHCWRCKTPLIFLTTNQWFVSISKIKDQMLNEIDKTEWHPGFAKERFKEFVTNAPDWCISRQRYWGIPLPIWKCECEKIRVIGSRDEIPKIEELHRPYIDEVELDCECGKKMKRVPDVLDVWFDSGNAIWASLNPEEAKKYGERADLILEGQDQIRGWFYSLLGSGVVRQGACPYKRLLMHGFFVDEHGEKMSKSLGNFIPIEQILEKYGADSFRLWSISNTVWDELKFSWVEMKKASSDLNIAANMISFLERFYPKKKIEEVELEPLDKWMLSRLNSTLKSFRNSFETYELNKAAKILRSFIVEDISRFYMKLAKERISKGENAEAALYVVYHVMLSSLKMLSCICPLLCESLYQRFYKKFEGEESLFLLVLESSNEADINVLYEKQVENLKEVVSTAMLARQEAGIKVRWPIRTLYVETKSHEVIDAVNAFEKTILSLTNVKELKTLEEKPSGELSSSEFEKGTIHIDKKIDEQLYEEGMVNEVKRRVQILRKDAGLVESDKIKFTLETEAEIEAIVKKNEKKIASEVNASSVVYGPAKDPKEYKIDGRLVKLSVQKDI